MIAPSSANQFAWFFGVRILNSHVYVLCAVDADVIGVQDEASDLGADMSDNELTASLSPGLGGSRSSRSSRSSQPLRSTGSPSKVCFSAFRESHSIIAIALHITAATSELEINVFAGGASKRRGPSVPLVASPALGSPNTCRMSGCRAWSGSALVLKREGLGRCGGPVGGCMHAFFLLRERNAGVEGWSTILICMHRLGHTFRLAVQVIA